MKILIIGGSRFVGPLLIDELLKKGHDITVFNHGIIDTKYPDGTIFIKGDRNNDLNTNAHFDAVVDMCAYNGEQTKRAIEELDFDFFLNFGTAASYKKTDKLPLTEQNEIGEWKMWGSYNKGKCNNTACLHTRAE